MRDNANLLFGCTILGVALLMALSAPILAPDDPYVQRLAARLVPPAWYDGGSWSHPLGTDALGRDMASRLVYGVRVSLLIGFGVTLLSGLIGSLLGLVAGFGTPAVDAAIMYLITVRLAVPVILVVLSVVALAGSSLGLVIVVLGLVKWDHFAVVLRAATQQVRAIDYVESARAIGSTLPRIIRREILPNVFEPLLVVASLTMAEAILLEAALSFLGLGVQPPTPSWGLMIAEGKDFMFTDSWMITIPGTALLVLVLGITLLSEGLREAFTPRRAA